MNQGAKRHALKDRGNDLYETPDCATLALIRHELLPSRGWDPDARILEPSAGRGAIARHLIASGFDVVMTDLVAHERADPGIETGIDFLMETRAPEGCTTIVTNPPFKLGDEFIRHGLKLSGEWFAVDADYACERIEDSVITCVEVFGERVI